MTCSENIAFAFRTVAVDIPDHDAIIAEDMSITFHKLWLIIERFAQNMQAKGIGRRSVVGIDTTDMIVSVASIFALSLLGASYFILDSAQSATARQDLTHCLRSPERKGFDGVTYSVMDQGWSPKFEATAPDIITEPGFLDSKDTCWIMGSSGTTGRPKFVSIDANTVWKRVCVVKSDYPEGATRHFLVFGCNSRPFAIRAVATLLSKNTIIDSHDIGFLQRHGVNFASGSPKQLSAWLDGRKVSPKIDKLQVSGSRLGDGTVKQLLQSFTVVEDVYGSNETIVAHVNSHLQSGKVQGRHVASKVEIRDKIGKLCVAGENGIVRIQNDHMAKGYDDEPEETAKRFCEGWFYPGDIGTWGPNGTIEILGRSDDIVNFGGRKINLSDVDTALTASPFILSASSFQDPIAKGDWKLAACIRPSKGSSFAEAAKHAWAGCADAFGAEMSPQTLLILDEIPITHDGVPRRRECQEIFQSKLSRNDPIEINQRLFNFRPRSNDL
tara:strand:+ start:3407 stop:4900 length:1494 start_codon:yes stop_codon:yes gene_type:complete